ncbi:hypothetical protein MMC22_003613 [Lobaria immixta]|nr:hypothetical protein [Lobaria immixta]
MPRPSKQGYPVIPWTADNKRLVQENEANECLKNWYAQEIGQYSFVTMLLPPSLRQNRHSETTRYNGGPIHSKKEKEANSLPLRPSSPLTSQPSSPTRLPIPSSPPGLFHDSENNHPPASPSPPQPPLQRHGRRYRGQLRRSFEDKELVAWLVGPKQLLDHADWGHGTYRDELLSLTDSRYFGKWTTAELKKQTDDQTANLDDVIIVCSTGRDVSSDDLKKAVLANSLVNMQGKEKKFFAIDLHLELLNGWMKKIIRDRRTSSINIEYLFEYSTRFATTVREQLAWMDRFYNSTRNIKHAVVDSGPDIIRLAREL